jgi:hypothetical protein
VVVLWPLLIAEGTASCAALRPICSEPRFAVVSRDAPEPARSRVAPESASRAPVRSRASESREPERSRESESREPERSREAESVSRAPVLLLLVSVLRDEEFGDELRLRVLLGEAARLRELLLLLLLGEAARLLFAPVRLVLLFVPARLVSAAPELVFALPRLFEAFDEVLLALRLLAVLAELPELDVESEVPFAIF